ncbi:MAG: alpha/beta hydrolase [Defluviitaleaceae bacterium]|nr:alpha/beta hydrolase [Defluviitaleaceae bacterium]
MPKKQKHKYPAPGKMVNVGGHELHVFAKGEGEHTFVFLSGSGTRYPTADFEPLWSLLAEDNRIVVVEKAGYGHSDISDNAPRDIDTLLRETREALKQAGIAPPYVVVPHSYSGLEALYWAQTYPQEVEAIFGLDSAFPEYFTQVKLRLWLVRLLGKLGIFTKDMLNEADSGKANAERILSAPFPTGTPAHFFISDGKFAKAGKVDDWAGLLIAHAAKFENATYTLMDCGHYVHTHKANEIAAEMKKFVAELYERRGAANV